MKNALIAAVIAALVAVAAVALMPRSVVQQLGSAAGPVIPYNYLVVGGVPMFFGHTESLNSGTTTPMALQAPAATSTLMLGSGCDFSVSSSSAKTIVFAKASTPNATTTLLFGANFSANAKGAVVATTTTDNFVFAPNTWLVMSMIGGTGTDAPTGSCSARWQQVGI